MRKNKNDFLNSESGQSIPGNLSNLQPVVIPLQANQGVQAVRPKTALSALG